MRSHRRMWLVVAAALLAGCGGDDTAEGTATPTQAETSADATTEPATVETTPPGTAPARDSRQDQQRDGNLRTYTVREGDTLSTIAEEFDTTVRELVEANDIDDPDTIFPGDRLRIP